MKEENDIDKKIVDFHSTQLYINKKEDVDALNEDFNYLGLTNKSDYLRGLIMLGLEYKKNQERNVSIKEKESLIKLDELSNKINDLELEMSKLDSKSSFNELYNYLRNQFIQTKESINKLQNDFNKEKERYDKILGVIYNLLFALCSKSRISKSDVENGVLDNLPNRLKGGGFNK